jgi:uridine kinase
MTPPSSISISISDSDSSSPSPAASRPTRLLVAIDGIDGSGKSILADRLAKVFAADGVGTVLFHVDDFRRPVDWARTDRAEVDLYYDEYYDLDALDGCLCAFQNGEGTTRAALFDQPSGRVGPLREIALTGATVAIVEGIFVRRLPAVVNSAVVMVIETSAAEARRRLLVRDSAKGRSQAEIAHRIAARYFPAQDRYRAGLDSLRSPAVVIDNERPTAARLLSLDVARVPPVVERAVHRLLGWPGNP